MKSIIVGFSPYTRIRTILASRFVKMLSRLKCTLTKILDHLDKQKQSLLLLHVNCTTLRVKFLFYYQRSNSTASKSAAEELCKLKKNVMFLKTHKTASSTIQVNNDV